MSSYNCGKSIFISHLDLKIKGRQIKVCLSSLCIRENRGSSGSTSKVGCIATSKAWTTGILMAAEGLPD